MELDLEKIKEESIRIHDGLLEINSLFVTLLYAFDACINLDGDITYLLPVFEILKLKISKNLELTEELNMHFYDAML